MEITTTLDEKYAARVLDGAEFLDTTEPGWFKKIKVDQLYLANVWECILGQLKGDYDEALTEYGWTTTDAEEHGFCLDDDDYFDGKYTYAALGDLWKAEIAKRLAAEVTP